MKHTETLAEVGEWLRLESRVQRCLADSCRHQMRFLQGFSTGTNSMMLHYEERADEYARAALVVERVLNASTEATEAMTRVVSECATQAWLQERMDALAAHIKDQIAEAVKGNHSEMTDSSIEARPLSDGDIVVRRKSMVLSRVARVWFDGAKNEWLFTNTEWPALNPCRADEWEKLK